jgi:hypothetical protein
MTKKVRIENADNRNCKVFVEIWDKGYPEGEPDKLAKTINLDYPTQMTGDDVYITSTRYIIVKEAPPTQK